MTTADLDVALPNNLAYMLYTSGKQHQKIHLYPANLTTDLGTTGTPKGCLLTHEGLAEAILALSSFSAAVHMDNIRDGRYLGVACRNNLPPSCILLTWALNHSCCV